MAQSRRAEEHRGLRRREQDVEPRGGLDQDHAAEKK